MIIHNTSQGRVIETNNAIRPFRIYKDGRLRSFKTLDAAIKSQRQNLDSIRADAQAMREQGINC
jgi:hypothetical protein